MQRGHIVLALHLVAAPAAHAIAAVALSVLAAACWLLAGAVVRASQVTAAGITTQQAVGRKCVVARTACVTLARAAGHGWFASTLTILQVTDSQAADGARPVAVACLTTIQPPFLQVPVERLAHGARASGNLLLARAELAFGHIGTATTLEKIVRHPLGVTVALLATGEIEALRRALVTLDAHKVGQAGAVSVVVAGEAAGAEAVAGAHLAVGVGVVAGRAGVTAAAAIVAEAGTLAAHLLAHNRV